jgi:hypothetical protein
VSAAVVHTLLGFLHSFLSVFYSCVSLLSTGAMALEQCSMVGMVAWLGYKMDIYFNFLNLQGDGIFQIISVTALFCSKRMM